MRGRVRAMRSGWVAAITLAGLAPSRDARALDPGKDLSQYVERSWGAAGGEGLPQNWVDAIAQTADGYLWLGTQEGLVRFDGARFTVFSTRTTPALRSNNVSALLADASGALWIRDLRRRAHALPGGEVDDLGSGGRARERLRRLALRGSRQNALDRDARGRRESPRGRRDDDAHDQGGALPRHRARRSPRTPTDCSGSGPTAGSPIPIRGQSTTVGGAEGFSGAVVVALHESASGTLWIGRKGRASSPVGPARFNPWRRTRRFRRRDGHRPRGRRRWKRVGRDRPRRRVSDPRRRRPDGGEAGVRYAVSAFFEDRETNLWMRRQPARANAVGLVRLKTATSPPSGPTRGSRPTTPG